MNMIIKILLFFITFMNVDADFSFEIEDVSEVDNAITDVMIDLIMKYHVNENKFTIFVFGDAPDVFYRKIYTTGADIVLMDNTEKNSDAFLLEKPLLFIENFIQRPSNMIFIFDDDLQSMGDDVLKIRDTVYWSAKAKIIIYSRKKLKKETTFFLFWWYFVVNCVILEYNQRDKVVEITDYNPYVGVKDPNSTNQFHCWSSQSPLLMNADNMAEFLFCSHTCSEIKRKVPDLYVLTCIEIYTQKYTNSTISFVDKTRNLNGASLNMFMVHMPPFTIVDENEKGLARFKGRSGKILSNLMERMNFTVLYNEELATIRNIKMSDWFNALRDLSGRNYEYFANEVYLVPYPYPALDTTYPVEGSGLCFVVHKAGDIPTWVNLLHMFDDIGALIMVGIIFVMTILIYFIYLYKAGNSIFDSLLRGFMYTLLLFLSAPVTWTDKNNGIRLFVFIIFWFIFVVNFVFQGTIVSLLSIPKTEDEINTFQELYDVGYIIEGFETPDVFLPTESPLFIGINKRFRRTDRNLNYCIESLKDNSSKACWSDCLRANYFKNILRNNKGKLYLHIGKDRVHSYHFAYPAARNDPITAALSYHLTRFLEAGLFHKWSEISAYSIDSTSNVKVLEMDDVQGCFYILAWGFVISSAIFLLEWTFYLFKKINAYFKRLFRKVNWKCCKKNKKK